MAGWGPRAQNGRPHPQCGLRAGLCLCVAAFARTNAVSVLQQTLVLVLLADARAKGARARAAADCARRAEAPPGRLVGRTSARAHTAATRRHRLVGFVVRRCGQVVERGGCVEAAQGWGIRKSERSAGRARFPSMAYDDASRHACAAAPRTRAGFAHRAPRSCRSRTHQSRRRRCGRGAASSASPRRTRSAARARSARRRARRAGARAVARRATEEADPYPEGLTAGPCRRERGSGELSIRRMRGFRGAGGLYQSMCYV